MYMRWTGLGCLMPALVIALLLVSIYAGAILTGSDSISAAALVGAGVAALLAPLHWLLGWALNFDSRHGWHDNHTYFDVPVQYGFVPQLVIALVIGSVALGQLTSPLYGWLLFGGVAVGTLVGYGLLDKERHLGPVGCWVAFYALVVLVIGAIAVGQMIGTTYAWLLFGGVPVVALVVGIVALFVSAGIGLRQQLRSVADRKEFAASRGWLYEAMNSDLGLRWQDLFGQKAARAISPFGVVAGEVEGLPFTAFDSTPSGSKTRRTYWAIHLPVSYPRVLVRWNSPVTSTTPDDLRAETANAAFGQALLTPQVRSATVASGLVDWRIEGRDLILEREAARPYTASEVGEVADRLAGLAGQLPADLADHFGTPPSTDIPLRENSRATKQAQQSEQVKHA